MNSLEIEKLLKRNPVTSKYFVGCFPSDKIPKKLFYPHCMVVNTDPSYLCGTHWIAIYVNNSNSVEYYDSFGDWPPISTFIINFLNNFNHVLFNNLKIQSDRSVSCGRHVIYFLLNRCQNKSFLFIQKYLKSIKSPDRFVYAYVRRLQII